MANPLSNTYRLIKAGITLTYYGVTLFPKHIPTPLPVKLLRFLLLPFSLLGMIFRAPFGHQSPSERLVTALTKLGPTYIKLGQFLATRSDIIGPELAKDLSTLQDRLPPFPQDEAIAEIEKQLGSSIDELFVEFGPPIAAASIAQVHKAVILDKGIEKDVAVKVLRPGIEKRFFQDQDSFRFAANLVETFSKAARRMRPVEVVKTLDRSVTIELDLRLEASAISELSENTANDEKFRTPAVHWSHTTGRVLTTEWIDGTPISNIKALEQQGHNLTELGTHVLQSFLRHAMRDGFFHADMHPGNLFVDRAGNLVAIDCGIMGRMKPKEQKFLARILHGFVTGDYLDAAQAHVDAGYVPDHHSVQEFAQGLRAIGEPIADKAAFEISMARFLGQLLEYTAVYDMAARPELILLQKNMVIAEGVARSLNPELNLWKASEPVVKEWLQNQLGPVAKMKKMSAGLQALDQFMDEIPSHLTVLEKNMSGLSRLAGKVQDMDEERLTQLVEGKPQKSLSNQIALWLIALSLSAIAFKQLF